MDETACSSVPAKEHAFGVDDGPLHLVPDPSPVLGLGHVRRTLLGHSCQAPKSGFFYAFYPTFWAIPTMLLSESAAAATFGLINSIGQLSGFAGNSAIGFLNDRTGSLAASFGLIALVYLTAGGLILSLKVREPSALR